MSRKTKLILFIAVDTIVLLIIAAIVLGTVFLGDIIKTGINAFLPDITGTKSGVEQCSVNLLSGSVNIKNFVIGNPSGYKSPYAFKLGEFLVEVDTSSLFSDTIHIKNIYIDNMQISYETKFSESNIGTIKENIQLFVKSSKKGTEGKEQEDKKQTDKSEKDTTKNKKGKKFIIDKLVFRNGKIKAGVHLMDTDISSALPLPKVELKDIGKKSYGVTAAELADQIISSLYKAVLTAVKENSGGVIKNIKEQGNKLLKKVKGLF